MKLRDSFVWHSQVYLYVAFLDPHQGITCCCLFLPTTKAFVELIGREKAWAYLQCIYCKFKPRIEREKCHTIKSRCACVRNVWWIYMVANLILLCFLTHISLLKLGNILQENRGYLYSSLFFSSLFFRRASKYLVF